MLWILDGIIFRLEETRVCDYLFTFHIATTVLLHTGDAIYKKIKAQQKKLQLL